MQAVCISAALREAEVLVREGEERQSQALEEHVRARIVGGGGRVDYVQVWTRICEYLTIGWMVGGSVAVMFDEQYFDTLLFVCFWSCVIGLVGFVGILRWRFPRKLRMDGT